MNAVFIRRAPAWRTLVWTGVIGSVVAWAWAWLVVGGPTAIMLFVALASVVLAYRGTAGVRVALVGLMVAGFVLFLTSLYWTASVTLTANVSPLDWFAVSLLPMVTAIVLLLGAVTGFRHNNS